MLAAYLTWHLRRALAPLTFTDETPPTRTNPVAPATVSPAAAAKASRKTDTDDNPVRSFRGLLAHLATTHPQHHRPTARPHLRQDHHAHPHPATRLPTPRRPDPPEPHPQRRQNAPTRRAAEYPSSTREIRTQRSSKFGLDAWDDDQDDQTEQDDQGDQGDQGDAPGGAW